MVSRKLWGGAVMLLTLSGVPAVPAEASGLGVVTVRGTVSCSSNQRVAGVQIRSTGGGTRYVDFKRYPMATHLARYTMTSITTQMPTDISIRIGCGGRGSVWGSTPYVNPKVRVTASAMIYYNSECSVASCHFFAYENNTPAAPAVNAFSSPQCTARAASFWKQMTGRYPNWYGDAHRWDDNAAATGWSVRSSPRPDSIAVWQPGLGGAFSLGHLAYVSDTRVVGGAVQMKVYDRNWSGGERNGSWTNYVPGMKFILVRSRPV